MFDKIVAQMEVERREIAARMAPTIAARKRDNMLTWGLFPHFQGTRVTAQDMSGDYLLFTTAKGKTYALHESNSYLF